jgi:D-aminoacyl-tRNA deacylase
VNSLRDTAGKNIVQKLRENFSSIQNFKNFKFLEVKDEIIFSTIPESVLEGIDLVVFASKHKSGSGRPTLTCHPVGNFGEAEMGGKSGELIPTSTIVLGNYLRSMHKLNAEKELGFEVSLEVTHHGPYLEKPSVFIEIGSTEKEWVNETAGEIIAKTIATETFRQSDDKAAIGIGGGHYAPDFTKLVLRKNYSFGHICPLHNLQNLNENLLIQMIQRSGASEIVLNWKGLKEHKERILGLCNATGLPTKRAQNLLKE